jgi:hypothetical protein
MMSVEDILRRLAVEEVGGHEELQRDLWRDGKLGDLGGTVGVAHLKEKNVRISKHLMWSYSVINFLLENVSLNTTSVADLDPQDPHYIGSP